jgi:hypothetical protein
MPYLRDHYRKISVILHICFSPAQILAPPSPKEVYKLDWGAQRLRRMDRIYYLEPIYECNIVISMSIVTIIVTILPVLNRQMKKEMDYCHLLPMG